VDPEPPSQVVLNGSTTEAVINPPDMAVLKQRANFLRPDSLVAVIMMSDETDCSIIDYGQGWLVAANDQAIPRPVSQCAANPNDPCCRNCQQSGDAYRNCPQPSSDPNCSADDMDGNGAGYIGLKNNAPNLRCWQTKRRFGFDLLFGIDRYVNGLTQRTVPNRAGQQVPNPLMSYVNDPDTGVPVPAYQNFVPRSDSSRIYLAGVVGVPWQDLATVESQDPASANLTLMTFNQMQSSSRWDVILGSPTASPPVPPTDPFMVESIAPRSGSNPITGQPIVASNSTNPTATINGHEYDVNPNTLDDLQYACIFELPSVMSRDCTAAAFNSTDPTTRRGCDCKTTATDNVAERNRPLCQPPGGGPAGTQQYFAKAYPGSRYLQVLKSFGEQSTTQNAIVASICPKATSGDQNASAYGYNSVVNTIIYRLREKLGAGCLTRKLETNPNTGQIACAVIEVTRPNVVPEAVGCATPGRGPADARLLPAIWQKLKATNLCDVANRPACNESNFTVCALLQVPDDQYQSCLNDLQPSAAVVGYCYIDNMPYVDPTSGAVMCTTVGSEGCIGNPELVKSCDEASKRTLRFVSDPSSPVPAKNSTVLVSCGDTVSTP
jgi:hypothetical protein